MLGDVYENLSLHKLQQSIEDLTAKGAGAPMNKGLCTALMLNRGTAGLTGMG